MTVIFEVHRIPSTARATWAGPRSCGEAQKAGRGTKFRDDTLNIAQVVRGYGRQAREEAPEDPRNRHG